MNKIAIIVAGGAGTRMKSVLPKQFLLLKGKPIIYYSLKAFLDADPHLHIILVLPEEHIGAGQEIIDAFFDYSRIKITVGGRTRFHSVQNGLKLIEEECMILVHDAVRCLVSTDLIQRSIHAVLEFGTAIPAVAPKDSIRVITEDGNDAMDRSKIRLIQTPQAFHSKILLPAFHIDYKDWFTDEASVVEAYGLHVHLIDGEETNIKITQPIDLLLAEKILDDREIPL